ncbi:MAG: PDZ domain-containing protein [Kiritimatiellae bacterium]|nr:PDZ domain-containing protein [Kiritimatiellia bacterium]MBR1835999.1 PDZ domain-containing protein [Kiritimatiellia bacterium]
MKNFFAFLAAAAASAAVFAEDGAADASRADAAAGWGGDEPARTGALLEKCGDSVAEAAWYLKRDPEGRRGSVGVPYVCPNCGGTHYRSFDELVSKGKPSVVPAFALSETEFLVFDPMFRTSVVDRVEVRFRGAAFPAEPAASFPGRGGLLLATAEPVPGVKPLRFEAGGENPEKPSYFFVAREGGRLVAGVREATADKISRDLATGRTWVAGTANAILVDGDDRPVTVSLRRSFELGKRPLDAPAEWERGPAFAAETAAQALEARLAKSIVPVFVRLDPQAKEELGTSRGYRDYGRKQDSKDEVDCAGVVLPGGVVLVVAELGAPEIARLDKIEAVLPDGGRAPLEYDSALRDQAAFFARFASGGVPAPLEPLEWSGAPVEELYGELLWDAGEETLPEEVRFRACPFFAFDFSEGRGGATEISGKEDVFKADGSAVQLQIPRRMAGRRWRGDADLFCGPRLASLLEGREPADPEIVPRTGKDRTRTAWLGADTQTVSAELAREKKATAWLGRKPGRETDTDGALVSHVYPGGPADRAGIREGDILLFVRTADDTVRLPLEVDRWADDDDGPDWDEIWDKAPVQIYDRIGRKPWNQIGEGTDAPFTAMGIGADVVVEWISDGKPKSAPMKVELSPRHFATAARARSKALGAVVADLTFEVREAFKMEEGETGVVVSRVKAGSPADVAGLRPYEIVTKVDGEPVADARAFLAAVKGKDAPTLAVRRLVSTRVVRVPLKAGAEGGKKSGSPAADGAEGLPEGAAGPDGAAEPDEPESDGLEGDDGVVAAEP